MDAGADDTRVKHKQFEVFLYLPMALVLLLTWNGDFGMSPIYGHRGARCCSPVNVYVGRWTLTAMGVERFIVDERRADARFGSFADIAAYPHDVRFTPNSGHWISARPIDNCTLSPSTHHVLPRGVTTA
jgi:hypothetical protein